MRGVVGAKERWERSKHIFNQRFILVPLFFIVGKGVLYQNFRRREVSRDFSSPFHVLKAQTGQAQYRAKLHGSERFRSVRAPDQK